MSERKPGTVIDDDFPDVFKKLFGGKRSAEKGGPGSGHHGHSGRPGKRGGSTPGRTPSIASLRTRVPLTREQLDGMSPEEVEASGLEGMNRLGRAMSDAAGTHHYENASVEKRKLVKSSIAMTLAMESLGISDPSEVSPEEMADAWNAANTFVKQWSHSSNDEDMRSLAMQEDAAREFGVPLSEFTRGKIADVRKLYEDSVELYMRNMDVDRELAEMGVQEMYPGKFDSLLPSSQQRTVLRAMYNNTQSRLASMGFKPGSYVTVFRGLKLPGDTVDQMSKGQTVNFTGNAIESWTLSLQEANSFAFVSRPGTLKGLVLKASIPIEMLLSTSLTGFGCLTEGEVTVLGSDGVAEVVAAGTW
jgi:Fe2+ transport system protein FeoA